MKRFDDYVDQHQARFLAELQAFCRLPSVVAERRAIPETAEHVAARLRAAGASARVAAIPDGSPVVVGEIGAGPRTLLIYGHYDVQPADPLHEWHSDPYGGDIRDGRIYARGASDNKGPTMARIQAVEAYQRTLGDLPVRVKFLIEGEEEIGSPHLADFVRRHLDDLRADLALWEGNGRDAAGRPQGSLGQKGVASFNLRVRTAKQDQHSMWGALVPQALWRMVWALSTLRGQDYRVIVDGLMDHVRQPTPSERALLDRIPFDDARIIEQFGIDGFVRGLRGRDALAAHLFEPTCTINGLSGGYAGPGGKTVLPAQAHAKIDIRLVPDLTPDLVGDLLRAHLDRRGFADVEVTPVARLAPHRSSPDHPLVAETIAAGRDVYGEEPVIYPNGAGSGPMDQVCGPLGLPGISLGGMNHSGANIHGPNENIFVRDYILGIRFTGHLMQRLGGRT